MTKAHKISDLLPPVAKQFVWRTRSKLFDWRHGVRTCGQMPTIDAITGKPGVEYQPTHPKTLRLMLELPGRYGFDYARYTFIDVGSGMGRVLLMASEYPYERIIGVEYSRERHLISQRNVQRFHGSRQKCGCIEPVHCEASAFEFPPVPTVLYMFNPFGAEVMTGLVQGLQKSLSERPRSLLLIYHGPRQSHIVETLAGILQVEETEYYKFYAVNERP